MRVLQSLMELIEIRNVLSPQVIVSMPEEFALKQKKKNSQTKTRGPHTCMTQVSKTTTCSLLSCYKTNENINKAKILGKDIVSARIIIEHP